jgi:putative tryptophan/tyrosine transport system substrate-binding protein
VRRIAAFLVLAVCAAVPALAQDVERVPLVGVLRINSMANTEPTATLLRDELAALGDVDGKNIRLDFRLAEGDAGRLPELAAALVRENATVIVAQGPAAALAAQRATRSIPIVASGNDLVALGLVDSMPRPGHNITGVSLLITELDAKRLEVLKEIVPAARQFGLLSDPAISEPMGLRAIADTARALGVELQTVYARDPSDFPTAITSLSSDGVEGVNILSSPLLFHFREELGALLLGHKLPAICEWPEMAASACLASYGTTLRELYAMEAALTDKMLKGASPAETPAQQPTKFQLVINLKTAKAIGLTIPSPVLARADEVIE